METVTKIKTINDTLKVQALLLALAPELEKGKVFECIVKPHSKKRSLDANAYFHVLVGKIAKALGCGADEKKIELNLEYGTPAVDDAGVEVVIKLPASVDIRKIYDYAKLIRRKTEASGVECNYYLLYKQTHTLDPKEMACLIDGVVQDAQALGIETKTPDELAKMKSLWKEER